MILLQGYEEPSLQVCSSARCLENKAKNWNSVGCCEGTPRPTLPGYCSWCWSEILHPLTCDCKTCSDHVSIDEVVTK